MLCVRVCDCFCDYYDYLIVLVVLPGTLDPGLRFRLTYEMVMPVCYSMAPIEDSLFSSVEASNFSRFYLRGSIVVLRGLTCHSPEASRTLTSYLF